ncbi:MAG: glutamine synthetase type III, partial [Clostridia bacterium]
PAAIAYSKEIAEEMALKKAAMPDMKPEAEAAMLASITMQMNALYHHTSSLENAVAKIDRNADKLACAQYTRDFVLSKMNDVRAAADALETMVGKDYWPMPSYQDLLMSVW